MDFFSDVELLAIGSRLKLLGERLHGTADELYGRHGIDLQASWFPVLRLLHDKGPLTVGDVAAAVGQTHSAISQLASKLVARGLVQTTADQADRRSRRLSLTPRAVAALREAKPIWHAIREELEHRFREQGVDAWALLDTFAMVVDETLGDAIDARIAGSADITIVSFQPEWREHFHRLNKEWLERYFYMEEADHRVLSEPEAEILAPGGAILFALKGQEVVGTCALMAHGQDEYELAKMAVTGSAQGLGIGRRLLEVAIAEFERSGKGRLVLETNTKLAAAIRLYESVGFEIAKRPGGASQYSRANIFMVWRGWPEGGGSDAL